MHTCNQFDPKNPPVQHLQDGYISGYPGELTRLPKMVAYQPEWLDLPCQYTRRATDADCSHCTRRVK